MLIKPDASITNPSAAVPVATACGNCAAEERRLLHHVRHRGIFRRLCTSCVLRLHPQSFCPTCFQVYPPPPTNDAVLTCFKCYSSSHSRCVEAAAGPTSPPTPYICPLCTQPNSPIFKLRSTKDVGGTNDKCTVMDRDAAIKLLAAAKIASASMNKAAAAAKAEAERRAKEAAFTRKRAKEALEYVAHLVIKTRKKEMVPSGLGNQVVGEGGGARIDRVNNSNVSASASASASFRNGSMVLAGRPVNGSNQVLAALNAVGLKENGNVRGVAVDCAPMDVDGNGNDGVNFANMESGEENADISEDEVDLVRHLEEQMQHDDEEEGNSYGGEQDANRALL